MNITSAAKGLEALGNPTRLEMFRLLVQAGRKGAAVGQLQSALGIPASTLSHHCARLIQAGLVRQERRGRYLICTANYEVMDALLTFLTKKCCAGLTLSERPGEAA
jgi:DNA-binding transcriptional ArsR family regulator